MGKSKDLALEMEEQEYNPDTEPRREYYPSDIRCPNCFKPTLVQDSAVDHYCTSCGQEFVQVGSALRFK